MRNGDHIIGLLQEMLPNNVLTFNLGWKQDDKALDEFTDVRELQAQLKTAGIPFVSEANPKTTVPVIFTRTNPDGNTMRFDQHR